MQEIHTNVIKSKHVAFRLAYSDWLRLIQLTSSLNLSVTDFMHSLVLPALNDYPIGDVQLKEDVKQGGKTVHQNEIVENTLVPVKTSGNGLSRKYQDMLNQYL